MSPKADRGEGEKVNIALKTERNQESGAAYLEVTCSNKFEDCHTGAPMSETLGVPLSL